ncbi:MAG TPA: OmpA family protein [Gemmatimonadaceae bacterium]|jgi:OOP family OmpA-OmpF porin|nr:OmpA family protein [Gemmatimonadaceae bacterium]
MSNFLLDSITDVLRSGALGTVAGQLGQSEQQVTRGLQMSVASLGAGLAAKSQDKGFMRQLFDLATTRGIDPARAVSDPSVLTGLIAPDSSANVTASQFLPTVFGNSTNTVATAIAGATGMRPESAMSLLGMATPLVLGVLASQIRRNGMTAAGFTDWFALQRDSLLREAPPALRGIFGMPATTTRATDAAVAAGLAPYQPVRPDRWLWPAIAAILVLGVVWNVMRGNRATTATTAATPAASAADTATAAGEIARPSASSTAAAPVAGAMMSMHLPTGVDMRVPANGVEPKLVAYLQDPSRHGTDTVWFDFDRLLFEPNAATLAPSSNEQLHNVAKILVAYPTARATIGGYTDNTGDADANVKLSQDRASNVVSQLVVLGVAPNRLTAKGYGAAHPVADNNTDIGRSQNRRISIRITEK